ncbi:ELWxxDGT repeat protein [Emticicia sp. W12TSBA100-4]|uniref:ELWxxDGT repeat protein n=1 Tax=Emticicia sp. W12TSBA100-4 TaxID=3160965 RepID=UPI003305D184
MKKITYFLLILLCSFQSIAQISLIGQGCDGTLNQTLNFISYKGYLFFSNAGCSNRPDGIYKTNGDSLGTLLPNTNWMGFDPYPDRRGVSGKYIYFGQSNSLWVINGETNQVQMIKDNLSSIPTYINDLNGIALFSENGTNLWRSDGTEVGTYKIKDMPVNKIVSDGTYAYISDHADIWKSDGTAAGTVKLNFAVINNGGILESVAPSSLTEWNGNVFFIYNQPHGYSLRKIVGNAAITLGATGCHLDCGGTCTVCDGFNNVGGTPNSMYPTSSGIYFFGEANASGSGLYELWKSDGTVGGTVKVISFSAGTTPYMPIRANDYNSYPKQNYDNIFFFTATDPTNGIELWRSDGTAAGTFMVKDINAGPADSRPQGLGVIDGICYFSAVTDDNGREIWKSNGTEAGTMMVQDLNPGTANGVISPEPPNENLNNRWATIYNGRYYFKGISPIAGGNLFAVDGLKHYVYRQLTPTVSTIDIAKKAIFLETGTLILPSINVFYEGKIQNNN